MKQIDYVNAYFATNELSAKDLNLQSKWMLFNLRKDLLPHFDFYNEETKNLLNNYNIEVKDSVIKFESTELADEYKAKQAEIDNLEVNETYEKKQCKLSDIPDITIEQMEALQNFIEFMPE